MKIIQIAFKNFVDKKRAEWRTLTGILQKEKENKENLIVIRNNRKEIEKQIDTACRNLIDVLDSKLIPKVNKDLEARIFLLRLRGDFYRYMSEYSVGEEKTKLTKTCYLCY